MPLFPFLSSLYIPTPASRASQNAADDNHFEYMETNQQTQLLDGNQGLVARLVLELEHN